MVSWERRLCAYLIDLIPVLAIGLVFGSKSRTGAWIASGYMLLRDVSGASSGKLVLGLQVVGRDGASATVAGRVLRNAVFGLQAAAYANAPLAGMGFYGLALLAQLVPSGLFLVDCYYLVVKGERLSDRITGTKVVARQRKSP
jgi:uncharacterized RDD family membrane protein YckC